MYTLIQNIKIAVLFKVLRAPTYFSNFHDVRLKMYKFYKFRSFKCMPNSYTFTAVLHFNLLKLKFVPMKVIFVCACGNVEDLKIYPRSKIIISV